MAAPRDGERRRSGSRHVGSASFVSIARSSGGTRVLDKQRKNVLLTVQTDASSDILRLVTVESEVWLFGVSGWARGSVGHAQTSGLASLASSRTFSTISIHNSGSHQPPRTPGLHRIAAVRMPKG